MKLQNTLLTTTAICYYIFLFLQPADSYATRGYINDDVYNHREHCISHEIRDDSQNVCVPPAINKLCTQRNCSSFEPCPETEWRNCLYNYGRSGEEGYIHSRCDRDDRCTDENHRCVQHSDNDRLKFCVKITEEDWNRLFTCRRGFCKSKRICTYYKDGSKWNYCLVNEQ